MVRRANSGVQKYARDNRDKLTALQLIKQNDMG